MEFLQAIFSIYNEGKYKIIRILGIKIKFKNKVYKKAIGFYNLPIEQDKIVFNNYFGKTYGCNPKYITDEILRQKLPYKLVWLVKNAKDNADKFPNNVKLVEYNSADAMKELITAKLWISNVRLFDKYQKGLSKRPGQKYINTWHGSLGIKKVEAASDNESPKYRHYAKIDSNYIDLLLSDSLYDDNMFKDFWYSGRIERTGHPRCDIFFLSEVEKKDLKLKVFKAIGLSENKKLVLYLPTFRDGGDLTCLDLNCKKVLKAFEKRFECNWVLGIRLHPHIAKRANRLFSYNDKIINLSSYPDNLELLAVADAVITDYSSCIFDFLFTMNPGFIYAKDLDKYNNSRGFYYPLEETPFSIAETNDKLVENILSFDPVKYADKVQNFLTKHETLENGNSSKNVVKLIKEIMEEDK